MSSSPISWSPTLNAVYQDNIAQSTAALQDNFGPLSGLVLQTPPESPFYHVLVEVALDNLVHAARQELYQEEEENLHAHIEEPEPELQYPDPVDVPFGEPLWSNSPNVSAQEPLWDENQDVPDLELLRPLVFAPVATVASPAPPSPSPAPASIKQETPKPPTLTFSPTPIQPAPPSFDAAALFPQLFGVPPCVDQAPHSHPHQYSLLYQGEKALWCPQEELGNVDVLTTIPTVEELDNYPPNFITRFRCLVPHTTLLESRTGVLPPITLCSKVGLYPHSTHFPLGYLEVSNKDTLILLFRQFPPDWLEHFEGAYVPLLLFDFLDSCCATVRGKLHFTPNGLFVIDRVVRTFDML